MVIGSFLNIDALCEWLVAESGVCSCCVRLEEQVQSGGCDFRRSGNGKLSAMSDQFKLGDGCLALKYLYQLAHQDPYKFLNYSSHKERLARLNLKKDIKVLPDTQPDTGDSGDERWRTGSHGGAGWIFD